MSKRQSVIRYDYNLLHKYCEENCIVLTNDYSKENVVRDTVINAKCLKCENICSKGFRLLMTSGCFCKMHTTENTVNKRKSSNLINSNNDKIRYDNNYLNEHCIKNNIILTTDYSFEYINRETIINSKCLYKDCNNICGKTFRNFIKTGSYCAVCALIVGKERSKVTCLSKYGVKHQFLSQDVKERIKATNIEKYGYENAFQSQEVKEKIKTTNIEKYGVKYPSQSQEILAKMKKTNIEKHGVENAAQSQEVKNKMKETNIKKYGVEYPLQNAEIAEKSSKHAYTSKDYVFPSGRVERVQGYENYMLDNLLQNEHIQEDDIVLKRSEVPSVWYEDANGKKHRYFVDCFIKSQNRCIEAKSTWTAEKKKDCIYLKQLAMKNAGYLCEIWIYNGNRNLLNKVH